MKPYFLLLLSICVSISAFAQSSRDYESPFRSKTVNNTGSVTEAELVSKAATDLTLGFVYTRVGYAKEDRMQFASPLVCSQDNRSNTHYSCVGTLVSTHSQFDVKVVASIFPTQKGLDDVARYGLREPSQAEVSLVMTCDGGVSVTNSANKAVAVRGFISECD